MGYQTQACYDWWLNMTVSEFSAWYDNVFSQQELDSIEAMVDDEDLMTSEIGSNRSLELSVRNSNIQFIQSNDIYNRWLFERLTNIINNANEKYFQFDLNRIELLQYTVYNQGQFYHDHMDMGFHNPNNSIRKLSFSLQLSDPDDYEGGDLVLKYSVKPEVAKKQRGTIIFFPSYVMHQVTPITRGTRKSLVGWITGPQWR